MGFLDGFTRRWELHPGLGKSKSIISASKHILEDAQFNWPTRVLGGEETDSVSYSLVLSHHFPEAPGKHPDDAICSDRPSPVISHLGWHEPVARAFLRGFGKFTMWCQHWFEADTSQCGRVGGYWHTEAARRELHKSNNQSNWRLQAQGWKTCCNPYMAWTSA